MKYLNKTFPSCMCMWPDTDNSICCEFIFPQIYYVLAMVENLFLRAAWTLNISVGEAGAEILNEDVISTILIILEIFRWVGSHVCLFVCINMSYSLIILSTC